MRKGPALFQVRRCCSICGDWVVYYIIGATFDGKIHYGADQRFRSHGEAMAHIDNYFSAADDLLRQLGLM